MSYRLITEQKLNQDFRGHAERCSYFFTVPLPDQLGTSWTAQQMLNAHITELEKENSIILEYRLWEDKTPTWETYYWVEIVASASPLWWNVIIIGVLAIIFILTIVWAIIKVEDIAEYVGAGSAAVAIPLLALAAIGVVTCVGIYLVRRKS